MTAVLLQVLDTTIANVALPHMQASLSATQDTINWVLTSYIVASAIALPISGWLADRVGRKRLLLISVVVFTVASVLCATATSLPEMVLFRALQGVGGAFIVPLAQATLFDINPREKHGQAMALFGGGVMIGPILGPVLGGWLTDNYNWRWVFLVNLPVGIICILIMARFMPKTETHERKFDMFGFALLAIALASLQFCLDRGEQKDWFSSWEIDHRGGLAIGAGWMFLVHMITAKHPLFDRAMFKDRNFATSMVFMAVTGVLLLGRPRAAAAAAAESVRLFGAPVGLPDRAARRRHPDLDADRRAHDRQDRCAPARRDRRHPDGRFALHDDRLRDRPAVAAGDRQRRRPGPWARADLRAAADARVRDACRRSSDDRRGAPQPVAQHRRFDRHLGRQHASWCG